MGKMGGFMGRKSQKKETEPSSLMDAAAPSRGGMAGMLSGMKSMMGNMSQPQGNGMGGMMNMNGMQPNMDGGDDAAEDDPFADPFFNQ